MICTSGYYLYNLIIHKSPILSITNKNNNLIIELDNNYDCLFTDEYILPDVDSNKWVASDKEYKCYTKFDNSKHIFLKKNNKIVYSSDDVIYLETLSDKVYMALNDKKDLPIKVIGNINNLDFKYTNSTVNNIKNTPQNTNRTTSQNRTYYEPSIIDIIKYKIDHWVKNLIAFVLTIFIIFILLCILLYVPFTRDFLLRSFTF